LWSGGTIVSASVPATACDDGRVVRGGSIRHRPPSPKARHDARRRRRRIIGGRAGEVAQRGAAEPVPNQRRRKPSREGL
jgi:hypothetical protein